MICKQTIAIHVIPTGIGASIGGFAGDAGPANALLASCVDVLIANPNVVNAATLHNIPDNMLYTEGYFIDLFCKGEIALRVVNNHNIAVVFDKNIPEDVLNININAINSCKAVYGLNISGYTVTKEPVGIEYFITEDNISSGTIKNTVTLLNACQKVINNGATVIAVVCFFPDIDDDTQYSSGNGVDPIGGIEAIISHLICREFNISSAHAPAFGYSQLLPAKHIVDYRAAAEYFSTTFLPCLLAGLNRAPKIISIKDKRHDDIVIDDVDYIITPHNCLGSIPVISSLEKDIEIIAIQNNSTVLNVNSEKLNIAHKIINLQNYLEAAGFIMAKKNRIDPACVLRGLQNISEI